MTWTVPAMAAERTADLAGTNDLAVRDDGARLDGLADRGGRNDRRQCNERDAQGVANEALALPRCNVLKVAHLIRPICARCRGPDCPIQLPRQIQLA